MSDELERYTVWLDGPFPVQAYWVMAYDFEHALSRAFQMTMEQHGEDFTYCRDQEAEQGFDLEDGEVWAGNVCFEVDFTVRKGVYE